MMPMDRQISVHLYGKIRKFKISRNYKFKNAIKFYSDKLLVKEVQEMNENLPSTVKCEFPDHNNLAEFLLIVSPSEGLWKGGKFKFQVEVCNYLNLIFKLF